MKTGFKKRLSSLSNLGSFRLTIAAGSLLAPLVDHGFVPYPYEMVLLVTRRCNSRCQMCYAWKQEPSTLSLEQIRHILSSNDFSFVRSVVLSGGEPTLRPDLPQVYRVLLENLGNLKHILVTTNGLDTRRTIAHVTQMLQIQSTEDSQVSSVEIQVSLDGVGGIHDAVRGVPGAFLRVEATLAALQALQERFPRLKLFLHCVLMPNNLPHLGSLRDFAKRRNLEIRFGVFVPAGGLLDNLHRARDLSFAGEQRAEVQRLLELLSEGSETVLRFHYLDMAQMIQGKSRRRRCMMGAFNFILDSDGTARHCLLCEESRYGSLLTDSFDAVWFGPEANEARRQIRARRCPSCSAGCHLSPVNAGELAELVWRQAIRPRLERHVRSD